jgi:hypothetical protein
LTLTTRLAALLVLAGAAGLDALPAQAATKYDGRWSVEVVTERGDCDRAYRYGIVIEDGQARYAGGTDFRITGRVQPNGAVRGAIVRGSDRADVVGRLTENGGGGTWTTAGGRNCGGRWNAERRG